MRFLAPLLLTLLATQAVADVTPIKTPSGNIECYIGSGDGPSDIECAIHARSGPPAQPKPADCKGPWGHHFDLRETGPVVMKCGGPGAKNTAPGVGLAPYGQTGEFGRITCRSEKTGFECRNADGHGFFLSRRRQTVF